MKTAIMLITHGTPRSEGNDSAVRNCGRLKELTGLDVYIGYLHLNPTIDEAITKMLDDGIERIIAVPLFVFPGYLTDTTVREAFGLQHAASSGRVEKGGRTAEVVFTGTFADHPLIEDTLMTVCRDNNADAGNTAVMMIFHGSKTAAGSNYVDACTDYLSKKGYTVMAAYNEFQIPTVEEATDELLRTGKNILAIPMFVSPGKHTTMDIPPKLGLEGSKIRDIGNGNRLCYVEEIGMHPSIVNILRARIDEVKDN